MSKEHIEVERVESNDEGFTLKITDKDGKLFEKLEQAVDKSK